MSMCPFGMQINVFRMHSDALEVNFRRLDAIANVTDFFNRNIEALSILIFTFSEFVWSQEEHQNMGAWNFVKPRLANLVGIRDLAYAGRSPLCQPAVGVGSVHQREAIEIMQQTFKRIK